MGRRFGKMIVVVIVGLAVFFAVAQLIRPERTNPKTDPARTIQAQAGASGPLIAVLDRSCGDCHSNATDWSRYTTVAPFSWVVSYAVNTGRKTLNFSEWGAYTAAQQHALLNASCNSVTQGKMPGGIYTRLRPESRLSSEDIGVICAAARETVAASTSTRQ